MLYQWAKPARAPCRLFKRLLILCCKVIWCVCINEILCPPTSPLWLVETKVSSRDSFLWFFPLTYIVSLHTYVVEYSAGYSKKISGACCLCPIFSLVFSPGWISLLILTHHISWTQGVCWIGLYLTSPSQHCSLKGAFHRDHCFVLAVVQYLKTISLYILSRYLVV